MREHRPKHGELSPVAKKKANARSYAKTYEKRGLLERKPCKVCGAKAERHHPNYNKPLLVEWLCREHHLALHAEA
jgi:hypothetical protein